jgi:CheY-like chemotaxis protein
MSKHDRPVFLVVDDSADDRELARLAFERSSIQADLHMVDDGEAAMAYLRREGAFAGDGAAPFPTIVLLDLRMRAMDGYEVLEEVRKDENLTALPIVVFSTSDSPADVDRCYLLGCNSYLVKPSTLGDLSNTIRDLHHYWCELNESPSIGKRA